MADQNKEVSLSITFKQISLELDEAGFKTLLTEAIERVKSDALDAFAGYKTKKAAVVAGVPTLEEKGVEVGITVRF